MACPSRFRRRWNDHLGGGGYGVHQHTGGGAAGCVSGGGQAVARYAAAAGALPGRGVVTAVLVACVTAVLVAAVGTAWFGLVTTWTAVAIASAVLVVGTVTLAACGLALAAAMPSSKAMSAVGLGILLPVAFLSDVFLIGAVPTWMSAVGSVLPVKPMANLLAAALDPGAPAADPGQVLVLAAWLTIAATIASRSLSRE